ncbi:MAG: hypothetical protein KDF65_16790 [Anaerolineae bacterium]|nr:hypothetical protein [Anaerolineae bacterium]
MIELKVAAIGGKDSASGTDEDDQGNTIHVPTTLFAVGSSTLHKERVVSSEFKNPDNQVVCFEMPMDESGLPDWSQYIQMLETI